MCKPCTKLWKSRNQSGQEKSFVLSQIIMGKNSAKRQNSSLMWFLVQIKILIRIWNHKSVIRNKAPLPNLPLVQRDSKAAGKGGAISSLAKRFSNTLFKNYQRTRWDKQMMAKITLRASHYFGKRNRKKFKNLSFSIKHAFNWEKKHGRISC